MFITGSFLERLAENERERPKLQNLSLRKSFLTAEYAASLKKYPELRILDISYNALSDEIVEIIASLDSIQELDVRECGLAGDESVEPLKNMPSLKKLTLH